jgi:hypothetical protein
MESQSQHEISILLDALGPDLLSNSETIPTVSSSSTSTSTPFNFKPFSETASSATFLPFNFSF